jgi:hypothetical protein
MFLMNSAFVGKIFLYRNLLLVMFCDVAVKAVYLHMHSVEILSVKTTRQYKCELPDFSIAMYYSFISDFHVFLPNFCKNFCLPCACCLLPLHCLPQLCAYIFWIREDICEFNSIWNTMVVDALDYTSCGLRLRRIRVEIRRIHRLTFYVFLPG